MPFAPSADLPEVLRRWIRQRRHTLASSTGLPAAPEPLVIERHAGTLAVRLSSDQNQSVLFFEEATEAAGIAEIEKLGITRREAEVLSWVAWGKANNDIAILLGMSPRTVEMHLERIFEKLGVEKWHRRCREGEGNAIVERGVIL